MKRHIGLAAILICISTQFALAQPATPAPPDQAKVVAVARDVIKQVTYATLVTIGAQGQANARIVQPAPPGDNFDIWMVTVKSTRKVAELRKDRRATLVYFNEATMAYVTLLGNTTIVDDPREKQKHWIAAWDPYFTSGARDPTLVLVRFVPNHVEIVSPKHQLMGNTWGLAVVDLK